MLVTVAICTWNRADLLDIALESLAQVAIPTGVKLQVTVADNNSTDHTRAVVDRHRQRLPLTSLFVEAQGKSHALNAVVQQLEGDLVIWADDDVLFDRQLVEAYVTAARAEADVDFFGGWIVPRFLAAEPTWLRPAWRTLASVYAARELGEEAFDFTPSVLPFGANMAARVSLQKKYRFDPELGRVGELLLSGEETALMQQWLADGYRGQWVPQARLEHLITADRMDLDHLSRFFFSLAQSKRASVSRASGMKRLLRGTLYALRASKYQLVSQAIKPTENPARWIKAYTRAAYNWGRVDAEWSQFPPWMLPAAVGRLNQQRQQPRYNEPISLENIRTLLAAPDKSLHAA